MSVRLKDTIRTARLQTIVTAMGSQARIEVFTGTQPPAAGGAFTGVKLGTLNLSIIPAVVVDNLLTFNTITSDISADASGHCTWGRVINGVSNSFVLDFDCGPTQSLAVLKFTDTLFAIGDIIEIVSFKLTEANG